MLSDLATLMSAGSGREVALGGQTCRLLDCYFFEGSWTWSKLSSLISYLFFYGIKFLMFTVSGGFLMLPA